MGDAFFNPWRLVKRGLALAIAGLIAGSVCTSASATTQRLPVPRVTIYPGDPIGAEQLSDRLFDARITSQAAVYVSRDSILGKVARRTLLPGKPIPVNALRDAYLVTQGKSTFVVFRSGGLTITGVAIPLQSGGIGDVISLRNADTGTIIRGTVEADGSVKVGMP